MTHDARVRVLLARWDEARSRGAVLRADELCAEAPDLADEVRRALEARLAGETLDAGGAQPTSPPNPVAPTDAACPGDEPTEDLCGFLAPARGAEEIGRLGPYRVVKLLGAGGMGAVFQALDEELGRSVAIKTLRPSLAASPLARRRFVREARAAAALTHDHIATIHQVGEERGVPFLVMPLLHGESLEDRLRGAGRLPVGEVLRITRETAEGLAAAHDRGLVHRDIKPANLWLESPRGRVKILDFGLARTAEESDARLTQSGAVIGTPAYMPPEQALGEPVDHRGDLYSLGVLAYRMATGRAPFEGRSAPAILAAVVRDTPATPTILVPDLPPALADLIVRLLAKDPSARPGSAPEVVEAIQSIERSLQAAAAATAMMDSPAAPAAIPDPGRRRVGRRRLAAVAALALLTAAGLVLRPALVRRTHGPRTPALNPGAAGAVVAARRKAEAGTSTRPLAAEPAPSPTPPAGPSAGREAGTWAPGAMEGSLPGLLPRQAWLPGLGRWQVETVAPRGITRAAAWSARGEIAVGANEGAIRIYDGETLALKRLLRPGPELTDLAWDPAGGRLAVGSWDPIVRIWSPDGPIVECKGHAGGVESVAWSADGRRLASAGRDGTVRIWNVDGKPGPVLRGHHGTVQAVAWSPDGVRLASGGDDRTVRIWDATGGTGSVLPGHEGAVRALAWHPKDGRIASGGDDRLIRLWALDRQAGPALEGHTNSVTALAWSSDGARLLSGGADGSVRSWRADGGHGIAVNAGNSVAAVAWAPDGRRFAAVTERPFLGVWEEDGTAAASLWGPNGWHGQVVWARDGARLMVLRPERGLTTLSADGRPGAVIDAGKGSIYRVARSPDGERLAASTPEGICLLHPDGRRDRELSRSSGSITALAWAPDGKRLAAAYWDTNEVRLWDADGTTGPVLSAGTPLYAAAWSSDGRRIAAAGEDGKVRTWGADGADGPVLEGHTTGVPALAWRPGSTDLASGSSDGTIRLWVNGRSPGKVAKASGPVTDLDWAPGGDRLGSGDAQGCVRIWSASGTPLRVLNEREPAISAVAWSPRGDRLASLDDDAKLVVWDPGSGEPAWTAIHLAGDHVAVFRPGGELLHGDPERVDKELVVALEDERGGLELLSPPAFLARAAEARSAAERRVSGDGVDFAAERKAAQWLLRQTARAGVSFALVDGDGRPLARYGGGSGSKLPQTDFAVSEVAFPDDTLTVAGAWHLAGCRKIREAFLSGPRGTSSRQLQALRGCGHLRSLNLQASAVGDTVADLLPAWPELECLYLQTCPNVGDAAARAWPDCPRLRVLHLSGTSVTDEGLARIVGRCPNLDEIHIEASASRPARRLATLKPLRNLHSVSFTGDQLTDEGVAVLLEAPRLDQVWIGSPMADKDLQRIERLGEKLVSLELYGSGPSDGPVTDVGYASVARMRGLRELVVTGEHAPPSDKALTELARLPNLRRLKISISESSRHHSTAGVAAFREKRPDVALWADGQDYPATASP